MTQEEKRIKIAEACGWTGPFGQGRAEGMEREGGDLYGFVGTDPDGDWEIVPNYFNDLNACHEMEKALHKNLQLWWDYCAHLGRLTVNDLGDQTYIHASSSVRAEAFGRTLGLWKEGE